MRRLFIILLLLAYSASAFGETPANKKSDWYAFALHATLTDKDIKCHADQGPLKFLETLNTQGFPYKKTSGIEKDGKYVQSTFTVTFKDGSTASFNFFRDKKDCEAQLADAKKHPQKNSVTAAGAVSSAEKNDDLKVYYPSNVGSTWVYGNAVRAKDKVKIIESNGETFTSIGEGKFGFKRIYERRGNKLLLVANQSFFEGNAMNNLGKLNHVELMSPVKKNTKWKYEVSGGEERCSLDLVSSLTVKAGTFDNVIKRSCAIYLKENGKLIHSKGQGNITYFAPNVGMIKQESESGRSVWSELIEYKSGSDFDANQTGQSATMLTKEKVVDK